MDLRTEDSAVIDRLESEQLSAQKAIAAKLSVYSDEYIINSLHNPPVLLKEPSLGILDGEGVRREEKANVEMKSKQILNLDAEKLANLDESNRVAEHQESDVFLYDNWGKYQRIRQRPMR